MRELSIYDFTGRVVTHCTNPAETFEINVEDLQTGVYFVKFLFDNQTVTKEFVKM